MNRLKQPETEQKNILFLKLQSFTNQWNHTKKIALDEATLKESWKESCVTNGAHWFFLH